MKVNINIIAKIAMHRNMNNGVAPQLTNMF